MIFTRRRLATVGATFGDLLKEGSYTTYDDSAHNFKFILRMIFEGYQIKLNKASLETKKEEIHSKI